MVSAGARAEVKSLKWYVGALVMVDSHVGDIASHVPESFSFIVDPTAVDWAGAFVNSRNCVSLIDSA